jgi:hypothetical protein
MHALLLLGQIIDVDNIIVHKLPAPVLRQLHQPGLIEEPPQIGYFRRIDAYLFSNNQFLCLKHLLSLSLLLTSSSVTYYFFFSTRWKNLAAPANFIIAFMTNNFISLLSQFTTNSNKLAR